MRKSTNKTFLLSHSWQYVHWFIIPIVAVASTFWPSISSNLRLFPGDPGDTLLNLYFLEHAVQHFTSVNIFKPDEYWSPNFFWPVKDTLAWSDHLLGPSVIYGFWRTVFNPFQAYICWLSTTLCLNYVSLRWALIRISPKASATWISLAALVSSFSPALLQQIGHPQLLSLFIFGPILYGCHKLITSKPESITCADLAGLASWLLINGFFNIYTFVYSCFCVLICGLIHITRRIYAKNISIYIGKKIRIRALGCILFASINLIIYEPYLRTLETFGRRDMSLIVSNLPKPSSWLYSSNFNLIPSPSIPREWIDGVEQQLFPGWGFLILIAAAIITAIRTRKSKLKTDSLLWITAMSLLIIFSLCINNISLWPLMSKFLPGASSLRASSRVGMQIILFSSGLIALASQNWRLPKFKPKQSVVSGLIVTTGFISIWPISLLKFSLLEWQNQLRAITNALIKYDCEVFWVEPGQDKPWIQHIQAMHAQLLTEIPAINGYSGHFPKGKWPFKHEEKKNLLSFQSEHKLNEIRKKLGLAKGERIFLNLLAAANQDNNPDDFNSGEINYAVELVRRAKIKTPPSFANTTVDEVRSVAQKLSEHGLHGLFEQNEAAMRASQFTIAQHLRGFKISNFKYSDFYFIQDRKRQGYKLPYINDDLSLSRFFQSNGQQKPKENSIKPRSPQTLAREYLEYYKKIYENQTTRELKIIDLEYFDSSLGNHAYGWSDMASLMEAHRSKNDSPTDNRCLIRLEDDTPHTNYIKASEVIFPELIYGNKKLVIFSDLKDKLGFSTLKEESWINSKYLRKNGEKISADQGAWAIKNASVSNKYLLINLINPGGEDFLQWKFDVNNGELIDINALSSSMIPPPSELSVANNQPSRFLRGPGIELAKDQHGRLLFKRSTDPESMGWQVILKGGKPVKYHQFPYRIVAARASDELIEILNTHIEEHIGYVWRVDSQSGLFIGQDNLKGESKIEQEIYRLKP